MAFRPRRTPPPAIAGVNLKPRSNPFPAPPQPRPDPNPSSRWTTAPDDKRKKGRGSDAKAKSKADRDLLGGEGRKAGWLSPWHTDYYDRVDDSTLDHPELLHGDPHMPVAQLSRGDGKVVLDPYGRKAREMNDYLSARGSGGNGKGKEGVMVADLDEFDSLEEYLALDDGDAEGGDDSGDDPDDLERTYGSDAADAIRTHLHSSRTRLDAAEASGSNVYSPLREVEERFRTIDRITSMENTTQDLALKRRARAEGREFFELGRIPELPSGDGRDGGDGEDEAGGEGVTEVGIGKGRGHDAKSVFGPGAKVHYPYGFQPPTPTYHPDFPKGSNVGDSPEDPEEEPWMHELNRLIEEERGKEMELGELDDTYEPVHIQKEEMDYYIRERKRTKRWKLLERENEHEMDREEKPDQILEMIKNGEDPNQEAFGPWGECTIKVDRVQKVERGGTTVRYRALVIGGNGNGAAGFGIGKALSPNEAIVKACKHCKRNVFYVDRYLGTGLSYDLAGKHNSCRVHLRATNPDYGLHGHPLITEILKYAGITDATGKSMGNRNPYNVVYATFKALMTHESLEEIAIKRGKKLLNLQRARRLGIS